MIQETRRTHVRVYNRDGELVIAMDTDVDENRLAKDLLELLFCYGSE